MKRKDQPLTIIIILNWNGFNDTKKCIESLFNIKDANFKIIVIDNGSKQNDGAKLKGSFGNNILVHILKNNLGFTGGVNYGIELAKRYNPSYYLLLNNDTQVDDNFLFHLIGTAESNDSYGIVGPVIFDYSNRNKITFSGGDINWWLGKTIHKTNQIYDDKKCKFITGGCFLIKKEVVDKIGLLDNRFFAYFEDSAYCISARAMGYKCVCSSKAKIYHKEGASTEKTGPFKTYLISRNRILFINNYAPIYVRIYFSIFNFLKLIYAMIYFNLTNQRKRSLAYLKGYRDGILGKGGYPHL